MMKKINQLIALMIVIALLYGCSAFPVQEGSSDNASEISAEESSTSTDAVPTSEMEVTTGEETASQATKATTEAVEIVPVEDVIDYFCEVVLNTEYPSGDGDAHVVRKWTEKICYRIYGEATEQDKQVLSTLFQKLNEIEGFPGIVPAGEMELTDLSLYFYDRETFDQNFGEVINYEAADGAVQFWYFTDTYEIYDARIGYRTDIDQYTRNSVLLEEVINGLGITDTILREDSITYQGFSQTQGLSEMDWLILKLLYHPEIKCGMNRDECAKVIIKLLHD